MKTARDLMTNGNIHALAVTRDDALLGILTDRDLKKAEASDATSLDVYELAYLLEKIPVARIMQPDPVTIEFDTTLAEAADLFLEHKAEAFPVMAGGDQLVGMLTPSDISRAFLKMTAFSRRGVHFGIRVEDTPGAVMAIISLVRDAGARLASLVTTNSSSGGTEREAYLHVYQFSRSKLPGLIDRLREKGTLLYLVDLKTDDRRIFER
jgi:acetoin utilization protein AcuB